MRKSSKNRDGVSLEGTKQEGHGYEPSVLVFGRYDRIQNLLKRKRGINELSAVYAKNIKVHNTTLFLLSTPIWLRPIFECRERL